MSAGTIAEGKRDYRVRVVGQFSDPEQVLGTIVAYRDGKPVYLRDIGTVELSYEKSRGFVRSLGQPCLAINVLRQTNANVVEVMSGVNEQIEQVRLDILPNLDDRVGPHLRLRQVYDETIYISSAIDLVLQNLWIGGILAGVVLLVFLRSVPATLVIALAIPISVIGTFLVLLGLGRTLNVISLAGLAFAVGMAVCPPLTTRPSAGIGGSSLVSSVPATRWACTWSTPTRGTPSARAAALEALTPTNKLPMRPGRCPTATASMSLSDTPASETDLRMLWDLVTATWDDLNGNGEVDPGEHLSYGGWDHQPAVLDTPTGLVLLAGSQGGGLALLDLDTDPDSAGFVIDSTDLGGGVPAVSGGVAVSAWVDGVVAFAYEGGCYADFDGDGLLTIFDFLAFQNAFDVGGLAADCDGDESLTIFDFLCFQNAFDAGCG